MNNALLRRLFSAIQTGSAGDVEALCRRIVEDERTRGHKNVAEDLQRILVMCLLNNGDASSFEFPS